MFRRFFRKAKQDSATTPPAQDPTSLGNILIRLRVVTSSQLVMAMLDCEGEPIGTALLRKGYCCAEDINVALEIQALMRCGDLVRAELRVQDVIVKRLADGERKITAEIDRREMERELRRTPHLALVAASAKG